ncbi:MAG: hypothetical protein HN509_03330 [Halobacteriovoraceae bacterium]|jgi:hypothetical protein|nr:hypothetical protein [Halobacteriovoraceae bacterium]MBT5092941.1 hypothetical protein [Halobacteriovoraceae bacterium]
MKVLIIWISLFLSPSEAQAVKLVDIEQLDCSADQGQVMINYERKLIGHNVAQFFATIQKKGQKKNEAEVILVEGVLLENRCQVQFFSISPAKGLFGMRLKYRRNAKFPLKLMGDWNLLLDKNFLADREKRKVFCTVPNLATYQKMFYDCIRKPKAKATPRPRPTRIPEEDLYRGDGGQGQGGAKAK